jgi:hypothetical protein
MIINVDKIKVLICVRGDLHKRTDLTMEDSHSPSASMRIYKVLMANTVRNGAIIFQLDVIGDFLQATMRSRV